MAAAPADSASSFPARSRLTAASFNARAELLLCVMAENGPSQSEGGVLIISNPGSYGFAPMDENTNHWIVSSKAVFFFVVCSI